MNRTKKPKTAAEKNEALRADIIRRTGIYISTDDARKLRRAALKLHTWHELQCGIAAACDPQLTDCVEEKEDGTWEYTRRGWFKQYDGSPAKYEVIRWPQKDNGAQARKVIAAVCDKAGLVYYVQTDPRGWPLYIAHPSDGMTDCNYNTRGIAINGK